MMCTSRMTKIVLSIAAMFIGAAAALAQDGMARGKVTVTNNPSLFLDTWQVMQDLKVAQELQAFLAPLRLPRDLNIDIVDCGAKEVPFVSGQPVKICNELIREIEETARKISPNDQDDQARLIIGAFIQTALHKTAYGVLDVLQVPVWGREHDAADRLAALIMVQFGEDIERVTMSATLDLFKWSSNQKNSGKTWTGSAFADQASPEAQRYFNYLCIAVVADYPNFGGAIEKSIIPPGRAHTCLAEYRQIVDAFNLRIMPYVDADALVKVRATQWLGWVPEK